MSLLLLSNDETFNAGGGISRPNSFTNVLQSAMVIKKNSEVALQSFKINKEGQAHVTESNKKFGLFIGKYLNEDVSGDWDNSIRNTNDVTMQTGTYDQDELIDEVILKVKKSIFHPDFQDTFNASVQKTGGTDFAGYNFRFDYYTAAPSSALPTEMVTADPGFNQFTYNPGTGSLTASASGVGARAIATTAPLSANQGSFITDFSAAGIDWSIGLSRYVTQKEGESLPPYANVDGDIGYFDFVARRDGNDLKLYHSVHSNLDEDGEISMEEVVYYGYTGATYATPYDLNVNASSFNYVEFKLTGDKMELYLSNSGGSRTRVSSHDQGTPSNKNHTFKPVNQVCSYLFPKINILATHVATIKTFNGRAPTNFNFNGTDANGNPLSMDFYRTCLQNGQIKLCSALDTRWFNDMTNASLYTPVGVNASGAIDFDPVLVVGNSNTYKQSYGRQVNGYGVANLFGFFNETFLKATTFGNTFSLFTSTNVPKYTSSDSIFVRLTSTTQRSFNGFTGNESKIIYHCPRFDNAGNEVGALYFEPGEKTYLDLGNIGDTNVNSFSIDIVDRNDKPVDGLAGDTIVMLHIREKK